jgi:hypothetical protein
MPWRGYDVPTYVAAVSQFVKLNKIVAFKISIFNRWNDIKYRYINMLRYFHSLRSEFLENMARLDAEIELLS